MPPLPNKLRRDYLMGIDPGSQGAIVIIDARGRLVDKMTFGGSSPHSTWDFMNRYAPRVAFAVLEQVGGFTGSGQPGSSMFNFGKDYGTVYGMLVASGMPFETKMSHLWQKALSIPPRVKGTKGTRIATKGKIKGKRVPCEVGGETKVQFKNRLKSVAERIYGVSFTLAVCDAALIAEYCRRTHGTRVA